MSDLYQVVYSGVYGLDEKIMLEESYKNLLTKVEKIAEHRIEKRSVIRVSDSDKIENLINYLDDMAIPVSYYWNNTAGVYITATFLLKGNDRSNKDLMKVLTLLSQKGK